MTTHDQHTNMDQGSTADPYAAQRADSAPMGETPLATGEPAGNHPSARQGEPLSSGDQWSQAGSQPAGTTVPTGQAGTAESAAGAETTGRGVESTTARTESVPMDDGHAAGDASRSEGARSTDTGASSDQELFADDHRSGLRSRWDDVQAAFVDDPKQCVQKADALVSEVVEQLTSSFADARSRLEAQWARGEDASTEDLRIALKRYREFFQRLLSV